MKVPNLEELIFFLRNDFIWLISFPRKGVYLSTSREVTFSLTLVNFGRFLFFYLGETDISTAGEGWDEVVYR